MNSSGMRRGLAVFAVSALAAVGLPLAASANTIEAEMDATYGDREVVLVTPDGALASTKNDGTNTSISLTAMATSDIDSLRFQFSTDGGTTWNNIGASLTSPNDDGAYSAEWTPGFALPAAGVLVQAIGHSSIDNNFYDDQSAALAVNNTDETSALTPGTQLGVYKSQIVAEDNIIVTGTASGGTTVVSLVDENGNDAASTGALAGPNFRGILNIDGSGYTYNAPDEVELRAVNASGTDDGEAYTLYTQVPTTITATANPANPADPNLPVDVTVTVLDQNGKPIAGAEIARDAFGFDEIYNHAGFTDAEGKLVLPGAQTRNMGTISYIVNETIAIGAYNPELGDKKVDLTVGQGFSADLVGTSKDGPAFDFDEYTAPDDIQVQVKDQTGANFDDPAGQDLNFFWKMIPFDGEPEDGDSHTVAADTNGLYDVPFAVGSDFPDGVLESGTYELWASLSDGGTGHPVASKKVLTVKAGEAEPIWDDPDGDNKVIAPAGTTATGTGKLVLEDGTGLPGRRVTFHFNTGTEYDEDGNTSMADANIVSANPATTGANGSFSLDVEDIGNAGTPEIGGNAGTGSANAPGIGDWGSVDNHIDFDFVSNQVPDGAVLEVEVQENAGPAGSAALGQVHLEDAFGDDLAGIQVDLSLDTDGNDGAFFINLNNLPQSAFADVTAGDYVHTLNDELGDTLTVSTDSTGDATFATSIGRDNGFDADGLVEATATGDVDGVSANDVTEWDSSNPFNVSEISIVRTPGEPENARVDRDVWFDLYAKDQYGNPAKGVQVDIDCPVELGDDDGCPTGGFTTSSDLDNGGDIAVDSLLEGTFEFPARVSGGLTPDFVDGVFFNTSEETTEVFANDVSDITNLTAADVEEVDVETSFEQSWYVADIDEGDGAVYTLTTSPANPVQAGQPVTATLTAIDAEGNPLEGLQVDFVRAGDPDTETPVVTDEDGVAQYVFEVEKECSDDTVTAVVRDTVTYDGDPASGGVVFDDSTVVEAECDIKVNLSGRNSENRKRDILNITTSSDADLTGDSVILQKKVDGVWKRVGAKGKTLDADGEARFSVRDRNGNKVTKYRAKVVHESVNAYSAPLNRR